MIKKIFKLTELLVLLLLFSCAKPEVIKVTLPTDKEGSCKELETLVAEAQKFKRDALYEKDNTGGNMARIILFWPAMATSFYNADKAVQAFLYAH